MLTHMILVKVIIISQFNRLFFALLLVGVPTILLEVRLEHHRYSCKKKHSKM